VKRTLIFVTLAVAVLAGCSKPAPTSDVATVNLGRISANWPKYINYQNQLNADAQTLERSSAPESQKRAAREALQARYLRFTAEIGNDVQAAASQVAAEKHYKLVVTREFVGYGGVDITADVEKLLKITEKEPAK
jgi:Skp family chaperone for outer membrane proteins